MSSNQISFLHEYIWTEKLNLLHWSSAYQKSISEFTAYEKIMRWKSCWCSLNDGNIWTDVCLLNLYLSLRMFITTHLEQLRLPRVQRQRPHLREMNAKTPDNQNPSIVNKPHNSLSDIFCHTNTHLWMPEHWIQSVMPRLMLAQHGSGWPQSQQMLFPPMTMTLCSALSPFRLLSFTSPAESRLPVDVDDFLSIFWQTHRTVSKAP